MSELCEPCDYCKMKGREYTPECEENKINGHTPTPPQTGQEALRERIENLELSGIKTYYKDGSKLTYRQLMTADIDEIMHLHTQAQTALLDTILAEINDLPVVGHINTGTGLRVDYKEWQQIRAVVTRIKEGL